MTPTRWDVARKDFEDAVRSRLLWGIIVVFVAFLVMALLSAEQLFPASETVDAPKALAGVAMLAQLFVPGIALVAGYMAVVGERRSGSLRMLLSYPFTRADVVTGKLTGRLLVTGTAMTAAYAAASVVVVALYGAPDVATFVGFAGAGVLLGLSFTALAVGGSAAAATRGRAMALTAGPYVAMVFFWKPAVAGLYYVVTGSLPGVHADAWYFFVERLDPIEAFRVLVRAALDRRVHAVPRLPVEDVPVGTPAARLELTYRLGGEVPVYLETWVAAVVLLAWGAVPIALGYWRFERADLG